MEWIEANWNAPEHVNALTTTIHGGCSRSPFESNNLALHVGDDASCVEYNRMALQKTLSLPSPPHWLEQTHSTMVVSIPESPSRKADASITNQCQQVLAVMTADCLPILLSDLNGTEVAAIHAGWRGLLNGIIENTLSSMQSKPENLIAWIGPGICAQCFEIGKDVLPTFIQHPAFKPWMIEEYANEKWRFDLPGLAQRILQRAGLNLISNSKYCTLERSDLFYSYRREIKTGRMATLVWIDK